MCQTQYPNKDQEGFNKRKVKEEFNNEQETVSENESQEDYNNLNESQENLDATYESSSDQEVCLILNLQQAERCIIPEKDQCKYQPTAGIYALH